MSCDYDYDDDAGTVMFLTGGDFSEEFEEVDATSEKLSKCEDTFRVAFGHLQSLQTQYSPFEAASAYIKKLQSDLEQCV